MHKKKVPVIHMHAVPAESDEYYPIKIELAGNIQRTLQSMNDHEILLKSWEPSGHLREKIKQAYRINEETYSSLSITAILKVIETLIYENTIVLSDVGSHKVSIARTFQPKNSNKLMMSNGLASMGIAIPGAIGVKLACPADPIICITGDGGALMNFSEIETAARLGLSFIIIVLNDSKLKLEEKMMLQSFSHTYGTDFGNPDYVQLAKSFGIRGESPADIHEFEQMLNETIAKNELTLIEIKLEE